MAAAGELGSPETPMVDAKRLEIVTICAFAYKVQTRLEEENLEDFSDFADLGIVDVVGDDKGGRKIIVVSACKLPGNKGFDNQRFLR